MYADLTHIQLFISKDSVYVFGYGEVEGEAKELLKKAFDLMTVKQTKDQGVGGLHD